MKDNGFTPTPTLGNKKSKLVSGFTLLEVIIYMALFSIMMGGLITITFQLIQSSEKTYMKGVIEEEINFVFKKIEWALIDAINISNPLTGQSTELEIFKNNFGDNPITFKYNTHDPNYRYIEYCFNIINCNPITTKNVKVNSINFLRINDPDLAISGIEIIININDVEISSIKYLQL